MSHQLSRLLRPRHLAVVGGGAWCVSVIEQCQKFGFSGDIWPVHPSKKTLAGLDAYTSVDQLPEAPDATFIGVNRFLTCEIAEQLAWRDAGGAVCFASGFEETSDPQAQGLQQTLIVKAGKLAVLGPNCYGLINAFDRFALWPDQHGSIPVDRGVAIMTQSSNIAINLSMQQRGLPVGYLLTTGNQAQQGFASIGLAVLDDERVTALGLHIEGIGDVAAFERLAAKARELGKPIVALKVGKSLLAQQATQSHTASLAGSRAGSIALLKRLGVYEAKNLIEFIDQLKIVHLHGHASLERLASLSCSGGEASLMADAVDAINMRLRQSRDDNEGLHFPALTTQTRQRLADQLGPIPALANPLDYHTDIWRDYDAMKNVFSALSGEHIDITLIILDIPRTDRCSDEDWDITIQAIVDSASETGRRYAVVASLPENLPEASCQLLLQSGVLSFHGIDEAVNAIAGLETPQPDVYKNVVQGDAVCDPITLTEADSKAWLSQMGVNTPKRARVSNLQSLLAAASTMTYPLVLKGEGFAHKSEVGALVLNLLNAQELQNAYSEMQSESCLVEEQVGGTVAELLVGVTHDAAHGYLLTLGAGGVQTELLNDTQSLLIPASDAEIGAALAKLKVAPLLNGFRGANGINQAKLMDAIMKVQQFVIENVDKVAEFEINPIICTADDVIAVDALIIGSINSPEDKP